MQPMPITKMEWMLTHSPADGSFQHPMEPPSDSQRIAVLDTLTKALKDTLLYELFDEWWINGDTLRFGHGESGISIALTSSRSARKYLTGMAQAIAMIGCPNSAEQFLLSYGQSFEIRHDWPSEVPLQRGRLKQCYCNASRAAEHSRFVYCEGVAFSGCLHLPHAWVFDLKTRTAYDPTWEDGEDYFGVPISTRFLRRVEMERLTYGALLDPYPKYSTPIIDASPDKWICEKAHRILNEPRIEISQEPNTGPAQALRIVV